MTITSQKTKSRHNTVQGACLIPSSGSHASWRSIPLSQGLFAIVDTDKYDWLMQWKWYAHEVKFGYIYARRREKEKIISMHRQILNCKKGEHTDHINHNTLDNRITNIRKCTIAQNQYNAMPRKGTSKYKGVYHHRNKWHSEVIHKGKHYHLGWYESEIDAAKAYDTKALELFGEFAYTNFWAPRPLSVY